MNSRRRARNIVSLTACIAFALLTHRARAQEPVQLIDVKAASTGWSFNNGQEFPGATGSLTADSDASRNGHPSLKLVGDFSKGGGYVQAGRKIDNVDIRELSLWVRSPDAERFTLRLGDASGQTHQIVIKTERQDGWQQVVLPLEKFFARRGEADAVTNIAKYESWGGAKDGQWHGPATAIYLLLSNPRDDRENKVYSLWLNEVSILPKPREIPGAEIKTTLALDEILEGAHDWRFTRGEEFKGAQGSLTVAKDEPAAGQSCLKLAGDFTAGGGYVGAIKSLKELDVKDITAFHLRYRTANANSITIQLGDGSGQTHQRKGVKLSADGKWHDLEIKPAEIAGGEHWGGANDAKWHGPPSHLSLSLTSASDPQSKQPVLLLADIRADALLPVFQQPAAFKSNFDLPELPKTWTATGGVSVDLTTTAHGTGSLLLARSLEQVEKPCMVTGPSFAVAPGRWQFNFAWKSDLHSPDSSYSGVVQLECLDRAGKLIERVTLADVFGKHDWQSVTQRIDLPKGIVNARVQAHLNKTYGSFWIDELSAAYLAPAPRTDDRIARMLFSTAQLGNLLFPSDPRTMSVTVETRKPLRESQHELSYVVRDYWGAEQMHSAGVMLGPSEKKGGRFHYHAEIDLTDVPLQIGRYYELHAAIPQAGAEPFRNYTSFAILPAAVTKQYKPEEVPFTSRNWDNRISEYIRLSDRLGIRVCGIWGGWSAKPPYKAEAPNLELCQKLGMGWLTTTPIAEIERGKYEQTDESLRQGVHNLIEKYGHVRPLIINLGNEPHGTGERVLKNVAAYRVVYEEVKRIDPTIPVVATSVEPNEEYFKAGYGQWCDAFDFHIYEDSANVRRTIGQYRELMKKYGCEKPIWSTELGLNSQGQTRHTVAAEVTKKFATFFAAGGANVSWIGLLYPDAEGKLHGSSGDSHNVFDCRYNRYAPRLDTIAYYNAVNAIAIKKFVAERQYPTGIHAFLFRDRDGQCLQVLWKEKGRQDVQLPLTAEGEVQVIRIDGSRRTLQAGDGGITLTITSDPLLLLYKGSENSLNGDLQKPAAALAAAPETVLRGSPISLDVSVQGKSLPEVALVAPPFWTVADSPVDISKQGVTKVRFVVTPPESTTAREVDLVVKVKNSQGSLQGELYHRIPIAD
jgi:hypothetical protein